MKCQHTRVRGIYGDEVWTTMRRVWWPERWGGSQVARVRCLDCGRPLYGPSGPCIDPDEHKPTDQEDQS